jgi:CRP-like cAMP-binding protein
VNEKLLAHIRQSIPLADEEAVLALSGYFNHKIFEKGETVLREGEICYDLYFVEEGYLRTYYNKDGTEINIYFNFESSFATHLRSSKLRVPSEFTIEAGEKTRLWILNRPLLAELSLSSSEIMLYSRRLLGRILMDSSAHNNLLRIYSPAERYQYIAQNNPQLLQRVSLSQLASYLGVTRRTLSRIRGEK